MIIYNFEQVAQRTLKTAYGIQRINVKNKNKHKTKLKKPPHASYQVH